MEKVTFKNGVVKLENQLEEVLESDFLEAQDILDKGDETCNIDAEYAYSPRVENSFIGTYIVKIERKADYNRFLEMVQYAKSHLESYKRKRNREIFSFHQRGLITREKGIEMQEATREMTCNCKVCSFNVSFEEWKTGKTATGQKLGKAMRKAGFEQSLLDFYSQQIKTEKEVYFTISDAVQHVAGMSYYSTGDWDGMGGKSCQCPVIGGSYAISLGGSLHDDKLFVGFTHDSLEDLEDLEGKMTARTVLRYIELDEKPALIATSYYGNNETKNVLNYVLEQLSEVVEVYPNSVIGGSEHREKTNGSFYMNVMDYVYIRETIEEEVETDCPACNGTGERDVYTRNDREVTIDCPLCAGHGTYSTYVCEDIEHEEEIEEEEEVLPYAEMYIHAGTCIAIDLDKRAIRDSRDIKENTPSNITIEWIEA